MSRELFVVDDPLFLEHRASGSHPERPERLEAARRGLGRVATARSTPLTPRDASEDDLARIHDAAYVEKLGRLTGHTAQLDADTFVAPGSVAAAKRAAGGAIALAERLLGASRSRPPSSADHTSPTDEENVLRPLGAALLRPPGHHARPRAAMGFCLLNNVALAAAHARALGARRVLVLDWDVHHGNGTQEAFYADPSVLYVSLHQFPYYPGTGDADELGAGDGRGYTVNVPLSAGAGDAEYMAAFDRLLAPILTSYAPDIALVSAGFDAHEDDPLADMRLTARGFGALAHRLERALPAGCPLGLVLEGGYGLEGLEASLAATLEAWTDPSSAPALETAPPSARHEQQLERAAAALRPHWQLG